MRILYHSEVPWLHTGYATCTEEIATRLHNSGHEVAILALNAVKKSSIWWHGEDSDANLQDKMKIYPAKGPFGVKGIYDAYKDWDADIYFTHFDTWMEEPRKAILSLDLPFVSYVIIDHTPAPKPAVQQLEPAIQTICMSEFAQNELQKQGINSTRIPHGIDVNQYYPLDATPERIVVATTDDEQREVDLSDTFFIGMIAANHGERKNIPEHLVAFNKFLKEVDDDAVLYLHTDQRYSHGFNLYDVKESIGIPDRNIIWPPDADYGEIGNEYLNRWYNAFDVFINCSHGESWGLTITEAQAAGTPCIVTDFSAMPEQLGISPFEREDINWLNDYKNVGKTNHGLLCKPVADIWNNKTNAKQKKVDSDTIFRALQYYYQNDKVRKEHGDKAHQFVTNNYSWENSILPKFSSLFNTLEETTT